jgi:hypothetical protein
MDSSSSGGVFELCTFFVYIDNMLLILSASGVGCYIESVVDALAYADDIVVIAPSAGAMRKLLNIM